MRLRNVKNKEEILNHSKYLIKNPADYCGKWNVLFQNQNPIYIEIGVGKGKFIKENAKKYPNINFIGIEKFDSILAKALNNIEEEYSNLYFIRMDALEIDKVFFHEIRKIYLNFSDPWPKKRHHLRRLTSPIFLDKYDIIFKEKKEIIMRTDNRELFEYSLEEISKKGYVLESVSLDLHSREEVFITTEYEDKFVSRGMPIYSLDATSSVQKSK